MSEDFRAEVKGIVNAHNKLVVLKKRKQEIKQEIVKINDKHNLHVLVDYAYIPQEDIEVGELSFLQETFTNCRDIIPCTVKNGVIKESWGWILDGGINARLFDVSQLLLAYSCSNDRKFPISGGNDEESSRDYADDIKIVKDGEYYIFLDNEYYAYFLMYVHSEKIKDVIDILEEDYHPNVEYGKDPPCHVDCCWYTGNSDRLGEWCGSYRLRNMFGNNEIIICPICRSNHGLADEIYDYGEKIRKAYKKHKKEYYVKKG